MSRERMRVACSLYARLKGLLGRDSFEGALLLVPCNDIHTFGMRAALDVAFVGADGEVLKSFREIGPKRRLRCRQAVATIERFASARPWYEQGDYVGLDITRKDE